MIMITIAALMFSSGGEPSVAGDVGGPLSAGVGFEG